MKKRFIGLLAIMSMLFCLPLIANAEIVYSGNCGGGLLRELDDERTLTISGSGAMVHNTSA